MVLVHEVFVYSTSLLQQLDWTCFERLLIDTVSMDFRQIYLQSLIICFIYCFLLYFSDIVSLFLNKSVFLPQISPKKQFVLFSGKKPSPNHNQSLKH